MRVIFVHGWDSNPQHAFFPWLKTQLEAAGHTVVAPQLPHPETPTIDDWVSTLAAAIGTPDVNTAFVGHSMGCQTILRYLTSLHEDTKVGNVVLVAGFLNSLRLDDNEERSVAEPWLTTPIDTAKVRRISGHITAFFSDNDEWVPLENERAMREQLGATTQIEHDKQHYSDEREAPQVLAALLH